MKNLLWSLIFLSCLFQTAPALASADNGWSVGVGYHNPPGATLGLNFMYLWTNLAFEAGIGYIGSQDSQTINSNNSQTTTTTYTVAGDVNLKYLFGAGQTFRPYIQGGAGTAISTSTNGNSGAGLALTNPFGGVGFFLMGQSFYFYASYIFINGSTFQLGIGF